MWDTVTLRQRLIFLTALCVNLLIEVALANLYLKCLKSMEWKLLEYVPLPNNTRKDTNIAKDTTLAPGKSSDMR